MNLALPRLPQNPTPVDLVRWADSFARALEAQLTPLTQPATGRDANGNPIPYQVTNYTPRRSLDMASTPSTSDIGDFLATVAADLKARGVLL